jgi:hypothetical protein
MYSEKGIRKLKDKKKPGEVEEVSQHSILILDSLTSLTIV